MFWTRRRAKASAESAAVCDEIRRQTAVLRVQNSRLHTALTDLARALADAKRPAPARTDSDLPLPQLRIPRWP